MATETDTTTPVRFGKGQGANSTEANRRTLFLDLFGGEVITAFDSQTITLDKHTIKNLRGAKSWKFPKTWLSSAEYFTPGTELLGNDFPTGEVTITADDILVAHHGFSDLDTLLSHFDVRSRASFEMGRALAKVFDKNVFRQIVLAARDAGAGGSFPAGTVVTDATLLTSGAISGAAWIDAIRATNIALFGKNVPEDMPRYMAVPIAVFDAMKYARDSNGRYLLLNKEDFGGDGAGGIGARVQTLTVDGVTVHKTLNLPTIDESAVTTVYSKYRANYSTTSAVLWTPEAVATVKLLDVTMENFRDTRRLEDFVVAKMLVGHGILRPECAVEFKTS